jgi:hypothetical protein
MAEGDGWFAELADEGADFFEDLGEALFRRKRTREREPIRTNLYGTKTLVKPAYLFARRVNGLVKTVAGVSVLGSAIFATVWGYASTKDLMALLLDSLAGRIVAVVLGLSMLTVGLWEATRGKEQSPREAPKE